MITQDDLELLNAYLDDALSPEERTALAARLSGEPALRQELESLGAARDLLRTLPTLRSPRDLTLTQAMVRPSRVIQFPAVAVSLVSAAASLVLIIVGVILLQSSGQLGAGSPVANQAGESAQTDALSIAGLPTSTVLPTATDAPTLEPEATRLPPGTIAAEAQARAAETASPAAGMEAQQPAARTATSLPGQAESEMRNAVEPPVAGMLPLPTGLAATDAALGNVMEFAAELPAAADSAAFSGVPSGSPPGEADVFAEELADTATGDEGVGAAAAPQLAQATLSPTRTSGAQFTVPPPTATPLPTRTPVVTPPAQPQATAIPEPAASPDDILFGQVVASGPDGRLFIGLGALLGVVAIVFALWARRQ